jgi:Domain of unknown function (DUF4349)
VDDDEPNWPKIAGIILIVLVVGAAGVLALGTQTSRILSTVGASVGEPGSGEVVQPDPAAEQQEPEVGDAGTDPETGEVSPDNQGSGSGVAINVVSRPDLLIIKTGSLSLQVAGIDAALAGASDVVTSLGGYAAGSDRQGDGDAPTASVTYRLPAASWEPAFERLSGLAQKVLGEHSATKDVTGEVVDLGARITNLRVTERALQTIMDRATEIKDVLTVQSELTKVRGQIEQLAAQKAHLEQQAAYSTLQVTFSLKAPDPVTIEQAGFDPQTEVDAASATLVGVLQDVAVAGIWFGIVWLPILVALGVIGGIAFYVVRRFRGVGPGEPPIEPVSEGAA